MTRGDDVKIQEKEKGFTLIEIVIVIAVLGILAGIAIPRIMDATAAARGARILADLRTIDSAVTLYQAKTGVDKVPQVLNGVGTEYYTTDDPDKNCYALLAAWPEPPKGAIIFPSDENTTYTITGAAIYAVSAGYGRACSLAVTDKGIIYQRTVADLENGKITGF